MQSGEATGIAVCGSRKRYFPLVNYSVQISERFGSTAVLRDAQSFWWSIKRYVTEQPDVRKSVGPFSDRGRDDHDGSDDRDEDDERVRAHFPSRREANAYRPRRSLKGTITATANSLSQNPVVDRCRRFTESRRGDGSSNAGPFSVNDKLGNFPL